MGNALKEERRTSEASGNNSTGVLNFKCPRNFRRAGDKRNPSWNKFE